MNGRTAYRRKEGWKEGILEGRNAGKKECWKEGRGAGSKRNVGIQEGMPAGPKIPAATIPTNNPATNEPTHTFHCVLPIMILLSCNT
jgi:hypothetical protein